MSLDDIIKKTPCMTDTELTAMHENTKYTKDNKEAYICYFNKSCEYKHVSEDKQYCRYFGTTK